MFNIVDESHTVKFPWLEPSDFESTDGSYISLTEAGFKKIQIVTRKDRVYDEIVKEGVYPRFQFSCGRRVSFEPDISSDGTSEANDPEVDGDV